MIEGIRVVCSCVALTAIVTGCSRQPVLDPAESPRHGVAQAPQDGLRLATAEPAPAKPVVDNPGFYLGEATLTPSERSGREIWYKATAGNARFHTYVFQQRVNVLIDWYRVLNARDRDDRFKAWGLINDPGCCMPGTDGCPAKSLDETYGFQWCPGDDQLLPYVGREGYRDPACDFRDAPLNPDDPHSQRGDQRQSPCDLAFGTSTGALGYRKFPNPRFDRKRWLAVNGSLASWDGYRSAMTANGPPSLEGRNRLADGSIEPPYLIGTTCGSCHIAFDPLNPPDDPAHPKWENLKGAVGNQYTLVSEILTSGMPGNTLEVQMFSHTRPGTTDTSAIASDQVYNPGTMNAIINTDVRPTFPGEQVLKWRKVAACASSDGKGNGSCWCEPGHPQKCWQRSLQSETVHHILKGGEDSIGAHEAVQRVYFNIGSCSEQCWLNHLTDLRQLDPTMRNFGQTPFDIGQCRRDCPNFRAIEDRLDDIVAFLKSSETDATDLRAARERELRKRKPAATYTQADLARDLDARFGKGAVDRGRAVFADKCARCHSSIPVEQGGDFAGRDFLAVRNDARGLRADWMGSDKPTPVTEVDTSRCRALHSNHMTGHIWQEYGSETLRAQAALANIPEPHDGGRGYYRNVSLLSAWAHAPFMHNNALGPELCGRPSNTDNDFYRSPYVDAQGKTLPAGKAPACWTFDPSVDGRFKLYVASMTELLNPAARVPKISRFNRPVTMALGPRTWDGQEEKQVAGFRVVLPEGTSVDGIASFQHKAFANDLLLSKLRPDDLRARLTQELGRDAGEALANEVSQLGSEIVADPEKLVDAVRDHPRVANYYSSCTDLIENRGHPFGEGLSPADKNALIAFVATL